MCVVYVLYACTIKIFVLRRGNSAHLFVEDEPLAPTGIMGFRTDPIRARRDVDSGVGLGL